MSYLAKREQPVWRQRLQRAYNRPEYDEALAALQSLQHELEDRNQSAAGSLAEGLDETLTLHRLGVYGVLGRSLKTTNGLESINALIEERCAKVDHWQNSSQRQRWLATALLDIEPRCVGHRVRVLPRSSSPQAWRAWREEKMGLQILEDAHGSRRFQEYQSRSASRCPF